MTPDVSAIVVNHRSAAECADCVGSLRRAFETERIAGEVVLVDCGSGPEEVARLSEQGADVLVALADNRGYSGGLNAGLAAARGPRLLLSNADVVYRPGAVTELLAAIADPRAGAAAPVTSWDAEGRLLLPPGDPRGLFSELARLLSGRSPAIDDRQFAAFAREALRLWRSGGSARHLIGAVLASRRDVFDRVGRFDERFPFEFEETEWEDRVRRAGLELRIAPRARVRHLWGVSAARNAGVETRRFVSRRRYRERRWGSVGRALLERAGAAERPIRPAAALSEPALPGRPGRWIGVSPNPARIPFAGAPLSEGFRLPADVAGRIAAGRWYFSIFRESDGRPEETYCWEKSA
jgi:GT2 family glycosyltransferase